MRKMKLLLILLLYTTGSLCEVSNTSTSLGLEGKIVGGRPGRMEDYPFAVQLYNTGYMCAGSILSSWAVLTAAHCFDHNEDISHMKVHAGSRYSYDFTADEYFVAHAEIHPNYSKTLLFESDIAIVFLKKALKFNKLTKKAVLVPHNRWMNKREKNFIVTGWGLTDSNGEISDQGILTARLFFVSSEECSRLHNLSLTVDMFCLYGDGKKDTCKGDSGGGVLWNGFIVGIVSHGDGCAKLHKPSVYSNVWFFRKWIFSQLNLYASKFCKKKLK